jgi:hypothetical protein
MAITFLEPGGDADFLVGTTNGFWNSTGNTAPTIATDFVHGGHKKSIAYPINALGQINTAQGISLPAGTRISFYYYLNALPNSNTQAIFWCRNNITTPIFSLRITTGGILQLWKGLTINQIGTNGPTLSTGQWYRISLAFVLTSATVNRFELFIDGISAISITNATLASFGTQSVAFGELNNADTTYDRRTSDHYIDNSSSLTDTGDIWVTAKLPISNGTTNGFTTQVGTGSSAYGSGHSLQVNERPLSTTNGWSMVGAGSAVTEEYNIEDRATGDFNLTGKTILGYSAWASVSSLVGETIQLISNGTNTARTTTSTPTIFTNVVTTSTYPAGTGADIGITTDTSLTTVSLYECGIIIASIHSSVTISPFPTAFRS